MTSSSSELVSQLFDADWRTVIDACRQDRTTANEVTESVGFTIISNAREPTARNFILSEMPERLSQLGATADRYQDRSLGESFIMVATYDNDEFEPPLLDFSDETVAWLLRANPSQVTGVMSDGIPTEKEIETAPSIEGSSEKIEEFRERLRTQLEKNRAQLAQRSGNRPAQGTPLWRFEKVVSVGRVRVPAGLIGCQSPWTDYPESLEVAVPPGEYPVRLVVATADKADFGQENAAAEVRFSDGEVTQWTLLESDASGTDGYDATAGVGSFGATGAFDPYLTGQGSSEDFLLSFSRIPHPGSLLIDEGDQGTIVAFTVGPQDQQCRTWAGRDGDGDVVALVTHLGLLDLDPAERPLPSEQAQP